jgi:hypothetical protein
MRFLVGKCNAWLAIGTTAEPSLNAVRNPADEGYDDAPGADFPAGDHTTPLDCEEW